MPKHLRRQIDQLKQKILFVGSMVESAIANAVNALVERDERLAGKVLEEDAEIDRMEVDVEEDCLKILALYQPVAVKSAVNWSKSDNRGVQNADLGSEESCAPPSKADRTRRRPKVAAGPMGRDSYRS